jgi:uncharacterized protein (UPF0248 family)
VPKGKAALKELVDEHLHRPGLAPADLEVWVADRMAEGGVRVVGGAEIAGARGGFVDLRDGGRIPFHRVLSVRSRGSVVYERARASAPSPRRRGPARRR